MGIKAPERKSLIVKIFDADQPNLNGRVYPRHELERALLALNQDNDMRGRVFGQIDMTQGASRAELDKAAFITGNLEILDDGSLIGEVVWLDTKAGKKARQIYEADPSTWFFRPAGIGKLRDNSGVSEIFDYRILSINMVMNGA